MDAEYTSKFLSSVGTAAAKTRVAQEPAATLHALFDAIIKSDFEAAGQLLTDEIELNIFGFGPIEGAWKGRGEVLAAARKNFAELQNQKPVMEGMIAQGDSIALLMKESGVVKSTGQNYSVRVVQWVTFADGKISKMDQIIAHH